MTDTKTILLIGGTGKGKSALANVLINKNDSFEEVFEENSGSVSKTKEFKFEKFADDYQIVDTPGIGDTGLSESKVLDIITEAIYYSAKDGISQIFFVIDGPFNEYDMFIYNLLKRAIFDKEVSNYITIIRTRFDKFRDEKECEEDINELLTGENKEVANIIKSCQRRVVHVDIPSLAICDSKEEKEVNLKRRIRSREKIMGHLTERGKDDVYKPSEIKKYYSFSKWMKHRTDGLAADTVSLERLFVIRGNLKQFINKWNKPHEDDWYEWLKKFGGSRKNELAELQPPKKAKLDKKIIFTSRLLSNGLAAGGVILSFQATNSEDKSNKDKIGAGLLGIYPITEFAITYLEKSLNNREVKWREFLNDADAFSDNFNELLGVTKAVKADAKLGKVNEALENLKKEVKVFLDEYDQPDEVTGEKNGEIDLEELINKRIGLAQDVAEKDKKKSKLWAIIEAIKVLEEEIIDYRQGVDITETSQTQNQSATSQQQTIVNISQSQTQIHSLQSQPPKTP